MSVRDDQLDTLKVGGKDYDFYRIADLPGIDHLPYSLKVLVENLVRNIDGANITDDHVKALLDWDPAAQPSRRANGLHCSAMSFGSYGVGFLHLVIAFSRFRLYFIYLIWYIYGYVADRDGTHQGLA